MLHWNHIDFSHAITCIPAKKGGNLQCYGSSFVVSESWFTVYVFQRKRGYSILVEGVATGEAILTAKLTHPDYKVTRLLAVSSSKWTINIVGKRVFKFDNINTRAIPKLTIIRKIAVNNYCFLDCNANICMSHQFCVPSKIWIKQEHQTVRPTLY